VLLFGCYLRVSRTVPVNSDGAANALQAWDMLHGNLLLHGWSLSDVSFYTTELPQYMLVEAVRGLGPDVVHVAAAISYTLLVLLAVLLARGRATGRSAAARMLVTAGILLAPALGYASYTLLLSPDHLGTQVALLLTWLLIDRGPRRWYVAASAGLLLAWALVTDPLVLLAGVAPLVIACLVTARPGLRGGASQAAGGTGPAARGWHEIRLAAAATAAVPVAWLAGRLISGLGGFTVTPAPVARGPAASLVPHALLAARGIAEVFGVYPPGWSSGPGIFFAGVHVAGLALAAWAVCAALRPRRWDELLIPAFAVAILGNVAAFVLSTTPADIRSSREIVAVLPLGAVLAGRVVADRLAGGLPGRVQRAASRGGPAGRVPGPALAGALPRRVLAAACAAWLLGLAAVLGYDAAQPPVPAENQALAGWLEARHLTAGLGGYWEANSVRLDSRLKVSVTALTVRAGVLLPYSSWETKRSWFDPARRRYDFVITSGPRDPVQIAALRAFGRPAATYHMAGHSVLLWRQNLLRELPAQPPIGPSQQLRRAHRHRDLGSRVSGGGAAATRRRPRRCWPRTASRGRTRSARSRCPEPAW
jgi:hypothetical protein